MVRIFGNFIDEFVHFQQLQGNLYQKDIAYRRLQELGSANFNEQLLAFSDTSGKIYKLMKILEAEERRNPRLKAIIFVKDRSVATYLKKILDFMFPRMGAAHYGGAEEDVQAVLNHDLSQYLSGEDPPMSEKFRCSFAIGFQGKSLTNKAYRSTRAVEDELA